MLDHLHFSQPSQISLKDLTVTIENEDQAYAALIQSNETDVTFKCVASFSHCIVFR